MLKKITLALFAGLILTISSPAKMLQAQENNTADSKLYMIRSLCDPIKKLADIVSKYDEQLLFQGDLMTFAAQSGQPYQGGLMFFTNQDTGTFTVAQVFADGTACVIGNGRNFEPYTGPQLPRKRSN